MTNEELDKARAEEAIKAWDTKALSLEQVVAIAARLAREGWVPVDPDLVEARELGRRHRKQSSRHRTLTGAPRPTNDRR